MVVQINPVDSVTPLPGVQPDRQRKEEEQKARQPLKDEVRLSHPDDERTLQLLLQVLADSLGHQGVSDAVRQGGRPHSPEQVAAILLARINEAVVTPFFLMTPTAGADDLEDYIEKVMLRLKNGQKEARAVFQSLETASPKHLAYIDEVGDLLEEALLAFAERGRLELAAKAQKPSSDQ